MHSIFSSKFDKGLQVFGLIITTILVFKDIPNYHTYFDNQYLSNIALDLFRNGGSLFDWHLIAAPRIFPDMLIYFISVYIFDDIFKVVLVSALILIIFQLAVVSLITWSITGNKTIVYYSLIIYLLLNSLFGDTITAYTQIHYHTGTFVCILFCLYLIITTTINYAFRLISITLISSITVISDFLFMALFLPAVGSWALYRLIANKRLDNNTIVLTLSAVCGCILGVILYFLILPNAHENPVHASDMSIRSLVNIDILIDAFLSTVKSLFTTYSFMIGILVTGCYILLQRINHTNHSRFKEIIAFIIGGSIANELIISLGAADVERYRILSINGMLFLTSISLALLINKSTLTKRVLLLLPALLLLSKVSTANKFPMDNKLQHLFTQSSCFVQFVDKYNLKFGAADFRLSQLYPIYSNNRLQLIPLKGKGNRVLNQFISDAWLKRTYHYIIAKNKTPTDEQKVRKFVYNLNTNNITNLLGKPNHIHTCGENSILIYLSGLKIQNMKIMRFE